MADATLVDKAQQVAAANGIPWDIFNAQIMQESGYNSQAVSRAGCKGIAQICDSVNFDPFDPLASLDYMGSRMAAAFSKYGNWSDALASYNCGNGCADKCAGNLACYPAETQSYIASILGGGNVPGSVGSSLFGAGGVPPSTVSNLPVSPKTALGVAVVAFLLIAIVALGMRKKAAA